MRTLAWPGAAIEQAGRTFCLEASQPLVASARTDPCTWLATATVHPFLQHHHDKKGATVLKHGRARWPDHSALALAAVIACVALLLFLHRAAPLCIPWIGAGGLSTCLRGLVGHCPALLGTWRLGCGAWLGGAPPIKTELLLCALLVQLPSLSALGWCHDLAASSRWIHRCLLRRSLRRRLLRAIVLLEARLLERCRRL